MEREAPADGESTDSSGEGDSTESILEALLVNDAEVRWDPATGKPKVRRRQESELDSPAGSE